MTIRREVKLDRKRRDPVFMLKFDGWLAEGMAEFCAREAIRDLIALVGAYRARCVIAEALDETSGEHHAC